MPKKCDKAAAMPSRPCGLGGGIEMDAAAEIAGSSRPEQVSPYVRWMMRGDMESVLRIERASYRRDFTWGEEDFRTALKRGSVIGKVAELLEEAGPRVVGFCVYEHELHPRRLDVRNLAVCPLWRLRGVGRALLRGLTRRPRPRIRAEVHEANLDAQLFFRAMGFRAMQVLRGHYDFDGADAYGMEYRR